MMREAADLLQEVIDCQRRAKSSEFNPQLLVSLNELALIYTTIGRYSDAENLFQEVINSLSRPNAPEIQSDVAIALGNHSFK